MASLAAPVLKSTRLRASYRSFVRQMNKTFGEHREPIFMIRKETKQTLRREKLDDDRVFIELDE